MIHDLRDFSKNADRATSLVVCNSQHVINTCRKKEPRTQRILSNK